jgi:transcriptional regulator with XRE-family HTH domain
MMEEIVDITMSELDYLLIMRIKELRDHHNLSQVQLSHKMNLSSGFVGKVELLTAPDKYSIRHLKLLANVFEVKSIGELFPTTLPEHDLIVLTLRVTYNKKKDGSPSKKKLTEVIKIDPVKHKKHF